MKINKLTLKNIGPYRGSYTIDFSVSSPNENIILIGGKNGAGKTTLLQSIKIALFGALAFGYRTENTSYLNEIQSMLNKKALFQGERNFKMILEIEQVENYQRNYYVIQRNWSTKNGKIKENFGVIKNTRHLKEQEKDIFQNKLRQEIPPQLFNLCLFDGEEIARIVADGKLPYYLEEAGKILFQLDLFENMEKDLEEYLRQQSQQKEKSNLGQQSHELYQEIKSLNEKLGDKNHDIQQLDTQIAEKTIELNKHKKDFEVHGGLEKEQRDKMVNRVAEIDQIRKYNTENLKTYIATLLPFLLNRQLLEKTIKQMEEEKNIELKASIKENLDIGKLEETINQLESLGYQIEPKNIEKIQCSILDDLTSLFSSDSEDLIHSASFNQRSQVTSLFKRLSQTNPKDYIELLNLNNSLLKESKEFRIALEENDDSSELKHLLKQVEKLNTETEKCKWQKHQLQEEVQGINDLKVKAENDYDRILTKMKNEYKTNNTFLMSSNMLEVSNQFKKLQLTKKMRQVGSEAQKMITWLFQKEKIISDLVIDPDTFEVYLYDENRQEISKEKLSAGEKELLMLSVIWAMFKTSGLRLPFIFDTLLGRLDKTHRKSLIEKFLPSCGEQAIVLSTDTEIDQEYLDLMETSLSKCYTLNYNSAKQKVDLQQDQYFNLNEVNLVQ